MGKRYRDMGRKVQGYGERYRDMGKRYSDMGRKVQGYGEKQQKSVTDWYRSISGELVVTGTGIWGERYRDMGKASGKQSKGTGIWGKASH